MRRRIKFYTITAVVLALTLTMGGRPWQQPSFGKRTDHNVYVAFGFHVNLYHSYRADSNDEGGFGKDIRVIRKILQTLNQANEQGIPVKAVWDMDNLFSLERYLPQYAPDIIEGVKRRVRQDKDEVILMSYNNALGSALNETEFRASINLAKTNSREGGLLDVFGKFSPIVRPQEMMTGPGCYRLYKELGVEAVVLYYSSITFDAFRAFSRPLSKAEAFNPLTYHNRETGEEMTVIPAYNIGDLLENGSLERMASSLHQEQVQGKIDHDVLIFINFDADDEFWTGYDLPRRLSWIPNTGGLKGVIDDVAGLDFVRFTTLADYLKNHGPVGRIAMGQDMADGNFNGYNNWAEKASTSQTWTVVEEDRRVHARAEEAVKLTGLSSPPDELKRTLDSSFQKRLELLSTTNYGMSVPDTAPGRRRVVEKTSETMIRADRKASNIMTGMLRERLKEAARPDEVPTNGYLDSFYLLGLDDAKKDAGFFLTFDLAGLEVNQSLEFQITGPDNELIKIVQVESTRDSKGVYQKVRLYVLPGQVHSSGPFNLLAGRAGETNPGRTNEVKADSRRLQNRFIKVALDNRGLIEGVYFNGRRVIEPNGLGPLVTYRSGERIIDHRPDAMTVKVLQDGSQGAAVVRLTAAINLPGIPSHRQGRVDYYLTLVAGVPYLFVEASANYPQTSPDDLLSGGHPSLVGYVDRDWLQVAPAEIHPSLTANRDNPFKVHRKNYLGVEASYALDYFRHSPDNLNLSDVNNHITGEYAALTGREGGIAAAADSTLLANFAFCPMKMEYRERDKTFTSRLNPFGSYFGPQYVQPSWGDHLGYQTALAAGGQYHSSAPSFNAASQYFSLMLSFFEGDKIPEKVKKDLSAFAHPPEITTGGQAAPGRLARDARQDLTAPMGLTATSDDARVFFNWSRPQGRVTSYKLYLGSEPGRYDRAWTTDHTSLEAAGLKHGQKYYVAAAAVDSEGREGPISTEVGFTPGEWTNETTVSLPIMLQLKLMTAGLVDLVR